MNALIGGAGGSGWALPAPMPLLHPGNTLASRPLRRRARPVHSSLSSSSEDVSIDCPVLRSGGNGRGVGAPDPMERMKAALSRGHSGAALVALRSALASGTHVDNDTFHRVISGCMSKGHWRQGMSALELYLGLMKAEGRKFPAAKTWKAALRGLEKADQVEPAVAVLRMAFAAGSTLVEPDCTKALDMCASKSRMALAEDLVARMKQSGIALGPYSYCILIKGYGRQHRLDKLRKVLSEMENAGVVPDVVTCNAAMDAFIRCGAPQYAEAMLESMLAGEASFPPPNTRSFNTIIKGVGAAGDVQGAFNAKRAMVSRGLAPSSVTLNTLVDVCVRQGDLERAYAVLCGAEGSSRQEKDDPYAARPSVEAYTSVLTGFAETGDKRRAMATFQQMTRLGIEPNVVTFTALVCACVNAGDMAGANRIFALLERRGLSEPDLLPNVVTYNSLIAGMCREEGNAAEDPETSLPLAPLAGNPRSGLQEAFQLLLKMRRQGVMPNENTINALLGGLMSCSPPRTAQARDLLGLMRSWSLVPDRISYSIMIKGLGKAGDMEGVTEMWEAMLDDPDALPDVIALNAVLDACIRNGNFKLALHILDSTEKDLEGRLHVQPDLLSYATVIVGLSRSSNMFAGRRAMSLYWSMRSHGIEPDNFLIDSMLSICCSSVGRRGALQPEDGKLILKDLQALGWKPALVEEKAKLLQSIIPALSEIWKSDEDGDASGAAGARSGAADQRSRRGGSGRRTKLASAGAGSNDVADELFEKHGWNKMDSGFSFW
jgi:pentatricopeptide repeat protein